jgi:hypothetical protein
MVGLLHAPSAMKEGFEDFLRERRERAERTQRLLIGVLAVTCLVLAISNVLVALWISSGRARPPESAMRGSRESRPVQAEEAPPSASIPSRATAPSEPDAGPRADERAQSDTQAPADAPRPPVTLPKTSDTTPADSRRANALAESPSSPPAEPRARGEAPTAEQLPPRPGVASGPERRASASRTPTAPVPPARAGSATRPGPGPSPTEEATATWMLSTYGRDAAESRARAALQFYDARSAEGRYWRRVLALIVAAR